MQVMTVAHCQGMESAKFLFAMLHDLVALLNLKEHNRYLGQ